MITVKMTEKNISKIKFKRLDLQNKIKNKLAFIKIKIQHILKTVMYIVIQKLRQK